MKTYVDRNDVTFRQLLLFSRLFYFNFFAKKIKGGLDLNLKTFNYLYNRHVIVISILKNVYLSPLHSLFKGLLSLFNEIIQKKEALLFGQGQLMKQTLKIRKEKLGKKT